MTTAHSHFYDNNEEVSLSFKDIVITILSAIICLAFIIFLVFKCRRRIKTKACNLDNEKMEEEPMLGETTDKTDLNQTIEHTPGVAENGFSNSSMMSFEMEEQKRKTREHKDTENEVMKSMVTYECEDSKEKNVGYSMTSVDNSKVMEMKPMPGETTDKTVVKQIVENTSDGAEYGFSKISMMPSVGMEPTVDKVTVDDENRKDIKESVPLQIESNQIASRNEGDFLTNASKSQSSTCVSTFGEKADMEKINEGDFLTNASKSQSSTCVSTFGEKADMEKINEMEERKQKITELKDTENDERESIVTYECDNTKNRKAGYSVTSVETGINDPIIPDREIDEDLLHYNYSFYKIVKKIKQNKDLMQDLSMLLQDTTEANNVSLEQRFLQWNEKFKFQRNLWRLQVLLKQCGADDLVEECTKIAKSCPIDLVYFDSRAIQDENRELLTLHTTMDIRQTTVYADMEKIRSSLARSLDLQCTDIELRTVKIGSLIFVFSLPKDNVKKITHEDLSNMWPLKVSKVETSAWIMKQGSMSWKCRFTLNVPPHHSRIQDRLQRFVLAIKEEMRIKLFYIKIDVHNIACTIEKQPCVQYSPTAGRKSIEYKPLPFEKEILENMEPSIVKEFLIKCLPEYHREIEDLFSPTNARRQTAKAILLFLSGKQEKSFKNTTNCVIDMYRLEEIPTCEIRDSMDSAMAEENGLFQNTERLLDEIDSRVIDETLEKIGDVPLDIMQKCSPGSGRKRKERAKTFYDFVNRNKEHFEIFRNILHNDCD